MNETFGPVLKLIPKPQPIFYILVSTSEGVRGTRFFTLKKSFPGHLKI